MVEKKDSKKTSQRYFEFLQAIHEREGISTERP